MNRFEQAFLYIDLDEHSLVDLGNLIDIIYSVKDKEDAKLLARAILNKGKELAQDKWKDGYKEGKDQLATDLRTLLNIEE